MGGVYLVKVWAPLSGSERREPMIPQVPQPLLFLRLVLEQFLLPMTARWMQIMNVNPASLFQGQTPKKGLSQGASVVNRVCLLCALGWVLPPSFEPSFQRVLFTPSVCERAGLQLGSLFLPRWGLLSSICCYATLCCLQWWRGGKMGCQYDCDIWMIYLIPLLSNLTLTLSVNSEPCLRCSCW